MIKFRFRYGLDFEEKLTNDYIHKHYPEPNKNRYFAISNVYSDSSVKDKKKFKRLHKLDDFLNSLTEFFNRYIFGSGLAANLFILIYIFYYLFFRGE